jgi:hypothetical protein
MFCGEHIGIHFVVLVHLGLRDMLQRMEVFTNSIVLHKAKASRLVINSQCTRAGISTAY